MEEKLLLGLNRHRREEYESDQPYGKLLLLKVFDFVKGDSRLQSHTVGIQKPNNNSPQEPL